jgi:hypothetical protein
MCPMGVRSAEGIGDTLGCVWMLPVWMCASSSSPVVYQHVMRLSHLEMSESISSTFISIIQSDIFSFFSLSLYMLETPRLTLCSSIKPRSRLPLISLWPPEGVNLSAKTYSFRELAPSHLENQGQFCCGTWVLSPTQTEPLLSPPKWTYSLSSETTDLWEDDCPCSPLCLMDNKPYFLFLKTLLLLFVNWHWS